MDPSGVVERGFIVLGELIESSKGTCNVGSWFKDISALGGVLVGSGFEDLGF